MVKSKKLTLKQLDTVIRKKVKEFTDEVQKIGSDSDIILSVKVIIEMNKKEETE